MIMITKRRIRDYIKFLERKLAEKDMLIELLETANDGLFENKELAQYDLEEALKRIEDLENNVEFLVNNLSKQKRELVRPTKNN